MVARLIFTMIIFTTNGLATTCAADSYFDSNGVKIRYVTAGTGDAVVLIHGWMSDSGMWGKDKSGQTQLNTQGAEGFQLIALDCRGHGKSDKPHDIEKYGPEMAGDVVRLLDHLKIKKAHLIGYSSGTFIAGHIAATHPDRVSSLIYAGQAPIISNVKLTKDAEEIEVFGKAVDSGADLGEYIRQFSPAGKPKPSQELAKMYAKIIYDGKDLKAYAAAGRSFKDLAVTEEQIKSCEAPILFIHGQNESATVKDRVTNARKLLGRGELAIIPGGDHMTTLTKLEFSKQLMKFLRSNQAGSATKNP